MIRFAIAAALLAVFTSSLPATASDGLIEINQTIAETGAVSGDLTADPPGFPVTISAAGSYRLTSNLVTGNVAITAVAITTGDVTLDLNGFMIKGCVPNFPFLCFLTPEGGAGVEAGGQSSVTGRNGTIRGMGSFGIRAGANARIENVHAIGNGSHGILCSSGSVITHSTAESNGQFGILCNDCVIAGNTANQNGEDGIFANNATVTGNVAWSNRGDGMRAGGVVSGNSVNNNEGDGIDMIAGSAIGNSVFNNGGFGLRLSSVGYTQNVLAGNGGLAFTNVTGGTSLGHNRCGSAAC